MSRSTSRPIDRRQHVWWHRLRRLGPFAFATLAGGVASPLLTVTLFGGVVWFYRYPWSTFVSGAMVIWTITAPIFIAACLWTWWYMEKRYAATLPIWCPRCGYALRGAAAARCPECGQPVEPTRAGDTVP